MSETKKSEVAALKAENARLKGEVESLRRELAEARAARFSRSSSEGGAQ